MIDKPDCELCRKIKKSKGKEPDCKQCIGTLQPENQLPFMIFWRVKNQVIIGQSLPLDLKVDVVRAEIAREIESEDRDYCFDLIMAAWQEYAKVIRERYEEKIKR
jgi:hypothetical protein